MSKRVAALKTTAKPGANFRRLAMTATRAQLIGIAVAGFVFGGAVGFIAGFEIAGGRWKRHHPGLSAMAPPFPGISATLVEDDPKQPDVSPLAPMLDDRPPTRRS